MEKRQISKKLVFQLDIEDSLEEAIETLQKYKEEFGSEWKNLRIEKDCNDNSSWYDLYGDREETDQEFNSRIELENSYKKNQEDREWNQYRNLRDKLKERILKENLDKILKP